MASKKKRLWLPSVFRPHSCVYTELEEGFELWVQRRGKKRGESAMLHLYSPDQTQFLSQKVRGNPTLATLKVLGLKFARKTFLDIAESCV